MATRGRDFGQLICHTLGLDAKSVKGLVIRIPVDDVVTIDATLILPDEASGKMIEVVRRYGLTELAPHELAVKRLGNGKGTIKSL